MEDSLGKQIPLHGQQLEMAGVTGPRRLSTSSSPTKAVHSEQDVEGVHRVHCCCCFRCPRACAQSENSIIVSPCKWSCGPKHTHCCPAYTACDDAPNCEEDFMSTVMRLAALGVPLKKRYVEEADSGMIAATGFFLVAVAMVLAIFGIYFLLYQRLLPLLGVGSPLDLGRDVYYLSLASCTIVTFVLFIYCNWLALKYFRQS